MRSDFLDRIGDALPRRDTALDRRKFLRLGAGALCLAGAGHAVALTPWTSGSEPQPLAAREARFYVKLGSRQVQCKLCPRECTVREGQRGFCRVRENRNGSYYSLVYSRIVAAHLDPIEKKPFFHFLPGALAYSVASGGCNVHCKFCQNWQISQARPEDLAAEIVTPEQLSLSARANSCKVLAYTYSEPVVFSEYVLDAAEAGHRQALRSVMVSNGFIQQEPLRKLCETLDAIKIDLKSFSPQYYRDVVRGELKPVLESIVMARKHARWLEIVYLTVPSMNDSDTEFRDMARWIRTELGPDVPVHFTRFYPLYLLRNLPPTPVDTLERARNIATAEGLRYVYIGNIPGHPAENTFCPSCKKMLVERTGFVIKQMNIARGACRYCSTSVPGVWS